MKRWAQIKKRLDDIGAVPATLGGLIGAPSILSLLQSTYEARDLSTPLQAVVDSYNQSIASAAAIIEPALTPLVTWVGRLFGWEVDLHAHWRHLFVLCMIYLFAQLRIRRTEKGGLRNWTDLPLGNAVRLCGMPCGWNDFTQGRLVGARPHRSLAVVDVLVGASLGKHSGS
jgi:hypothetical protein